MSISIPTSRRSASLRRRTAAVMFHRFALMRSWAEDGTLDLERAGRKERPVVAARLADCVGKALAGFVLSGAGGP